MALSQCKLCLKLAELIGAHIIPSCFYADNNLLFSDDCDYSKRRPTGTYDTRILCAECDNEIGKLDNYAKEVLFDLKGVVIEKFNDPSFQNKPLNLYRLNDRHGYDKLNRFFVSVLWRASISMHEDFASFNLRPYEAIARMAVLDESFDCSEIFSVVLCRLADVKDPVNIFSTKLKKIDSVNFYVFVLGICKMFIKVDKQKLPVRFRSTVLSTKSNVLMVESNFLGMPERAQLVDKVKSVTRNRERKR